MKKYILIQISLIICFSIILSGAAWCGQVVTDEIRQWAKKALEQENNLGIDTGAKTVAILYFSNRTGQKGLDPLQKGLTHMLITDLSSVKSLQVVERVRLQAVTEEMDLGVSGLVGSDFMSRAGKLLGARWLVGGDISENALIPIHVDSNILDVPDRQVIGQPRAEGILEEFFKIEKHLLFEIIEHLQIELTPEEKAQLKKPLTTNIKALFDLFKGIDESDRGNYRLAERYYEMALKRDPDITHARVYLTELRSLKLIDSDSGNGRELMYSLREDTSLTDHYSPGITTKREQRPEADNTHIKIEILLPSF